MKKEPNNIYLDYSAATPLDKSVYAAMEPYFLDMCANAGALHAEGEKSKKVIHTAREELARMIGGSREEIIFTSGGTESNNLAILGTYERLIKEGRSPDTMHMIFLSIEHSSVKDCMNALACKGVRICEVAVPENGVVRAEDVIASIEKDTVLVSVMLVNSEIGTIQPIAEISAGLQKKKKEWGRERVEYPHFHTDASQAPVFLSCVVDELGVDLMTIDGQKIYGPKGVGFLYIRKGVELSPIMYGGVQEKGLRPGTPNTPLIVGLASAYALAEREREKRCILFSRLQEKLIHGILSSCKGATLNGDRERRVCGNVNISFPKVEGEYMQYALSTKGIYVSTRSACRGNEKGGSSVVRALGVGEERAISAIRFSLGDSTTEEHISTVIQSVRDVCAKGNLKI